MSFANQDISSPLAASFRPLIGRDPYNKKAVDDAMKATFKAVSVLDDHLLVHTFLVGERLTLADLFVAGILGRGFQYFFDKAWRSENINVVRWYETIYNQPIYAAVVDKLSYIDEAIKNAPPKKEGGEKPKADKAPKQKEAAKPKAKEVEADDDEDEAPPAPKPKHPLEALPKPAMALDELKRTYSNQETREEALPWFWKNFNSDDYSLWKCDYKYNDELTMTFMTSNLIGKAS